MYKKRSELKKTNYKQIIIIVQHVRNRGILQVYQVRFKAAMSTSLDNVKKLKQNTHSKPKSIQT